MVFVSFCVVVVVVVDGGGVLVHLSLVEKVLHLRLFKSGLPSLAGLLWLAVKKARY